MQIKVKEKIAKTVVIKLSQRDAEELLSDAVDALHFTDKELDTLATLVSRLQSLVL